MCGTLLVADDFEMNTPLGSTDDDKAELDREVEGMIGMSEAKQWFRDLKSKVKLVEKTGDRAVLKMCLNVIITGNPGTGKTTFARLLSRFMFTYGLLTKDHFVEKNALELKGEHVGETPRRVMEAIR